MRLFNWKEEQVRVALNSSITTGKYSLQKFSVNFALLGAALIKELIKTKDIFNCNDNYISN